MPITDPDYVPPIAITFDEEKPIRSEQGLLLAGNPIAIALGKPGAPRIWLPALERLRPGTMIRSRNDDTQTFPDNQPLTTVHSFDFIQHGAIRVSVNRVSSANISTFQVVRVRNAISATLLNVTANGTFTVDAAVIPGDRIAIQISTAAVSGISVNNLRFQTDGADLWPGSSARLEGNRAAL